MTFIQSAKRRGVTAVQTTLVIGAITLVAFATILSMGTGVSDDLGTTAGNVADPSTLLSRFGDQSSCNQCPDADNNETDTTDTTDDTNDD